MFLKDLVIQHDINSTLPLLLSLPISFHFPGSPSFSPSFLDRSIPSRTLCRSGSSRHRCNVRPGPAPLRNLFRNLGYPADRWSLVTWVNLSLPPPPSFSLFLSLSANVPEYRRLVEGRRDEEGCATSSSSSFLASPWSLPCCGRVRARNISLVPLERLACPLSLALSMSVSRSAGRRTGQSAAVAATTAAPHTEQRSCVYPVLMIVVYVYARDREERSSGMRSAACCTSL